MGGKCGPYIYGTVRGEEEYFPVTPSLYIYIYYQQLYMFEVLISRCTFADRMH